MAKARPSIPESRAEGETAPRPAPGASGSEELPHHPEELVQAIVMEPVAGAVDANHARAGKEAGAAVLVGVAGAALLAVEEQGGAGHARPEMGDVPPAHVVGKPRPHVVVELPAIGPVL